MSASPIKLIALGDGRNGPQWKSHLGFKKAREVASLGSKKKSPSWGLELSGWNATITLTLHAAPISNGFQD
jgi:hypothetical protein